MLNQQRLATLRTHVKLQAFLRGVSEEAAIGYTIARYRWEIEQISEDDYWQIVNALTDSFTSTYEEEVIYIDFIGWVNQEIATTIDQSWEVA